MHLSMLFCFFMIWTNKKINVWYFYLSFLGVLTLYLMKVNVLSLLVPYFELLDSFKRVLFYLDVDRENNFLGIGFWERVITFVALCAIRMDLIKTNRLLPKLNVLLNIGMFSIIFQLLLASEPTIVSRLRLYTQIFPLLLIGHYIFTLQRGHRYWIFRLPFMIYLSRYFVFQTSYFLP